MGYPVLTEQPLGSTRRRLLGRRREPTELPARPPGAVYVFRIQGRYRQYEDQHIDLGDSRVVDATAVSVVHVRPQLVSTDIAIPSASPADDFTVRATFDCRVTRPETVAENGLTDLAGFLASHLRQDRDLGQLGVRYSIDDVNDVRRQVDAQINAYCTLVAPHVPGIDIDLKTVNVLAPDDLRAQGRRIRDETWGQDVKRLQGNFENEAVRRLADILAGGPSYAEALGISRQQINLSDVSERSFAADQARRKQLGDAVQELIGQGFFNRIPIDPAQLLNVLTGEASSVGDLTAIEPGTGAHVTSRDVRSRDHEHEVRPEFIPDEEDVD